MAFLAGFIQDGSTRAHADVVLDATPSLDAAFSSDGRIRQLVYDPNDIYTILTRVGYQSHIEFSPREEVETISIGERSFWQIIPSGSRLFIRPLQDDVSTNMTVITSKRSYQFDLKSVESKDAKIIYVARFTYPDEAKPRQLDPYTMLPLPQAHSPSLPPVAPPAAAPMPASRTLHFSTVPYILDPAPLPKRNYLYSYAGTEAAAPYEVFDDGHTTYFRYLNAAKPAPQVLIAEPGREVSLTVYQKNGYYAVDTVTSELVLRSAGDTVHLFNELLTPRS